MRAFWVLFGVVLLTTLSLSAVAQSPPFSGTIFIDPDIVTPDDPTSFEQATYAGRANRTMFDRRDNAFVAFTDVYLFEAAFSDGPTSEIQVNPEFGSIEAASAVVEQYAPALGQLPTALRADMQTVWIHRGDEPFGGGNFNILIHTGQGDDYISNGILEETLLHEAAHTSLDAAHATATGWQTAQNTDPTFISTYARDFPVREDIAESLVPYIAVRYRTDRISQDLYDTIVTTMPNRIAYFDQNLPDLYAGSSTTTGSSTSLPSRAEITHLYPNPMERTATIEFSLPFPGKVSLVTYDLTGREVHRQVDEVLQSGPHRRVFEAGSLPSGVYIMRLFHVNRRAGESRLVVLAQ